MTTHKHYDTLGVGRDASADDIKTAFRRKARDCHPDRNPGIDPQIMAAVNAAYEILGDAVRRARYDEHGDDDRHASREQEAEQLVVMLFSQHLQERSSDPLRASQSQLSQSMEQLRSKLHSVPKRRTYLQRQRKRSTVRKGAKNMLVLLIDKQLADLDTEEKFMSDSLEVMKMAAELLDNYEHAPDMDGPGSMLGERRAQFVSLADAFTGTTWR